MSSVSVRLSLVQLPERFQSGGMQNRTRALPQQISAREFPSFSWPVKIRVRARSPRLAPRDKPPLFPASFRSLSRSPVLLRTIEPAPRTSPNRRLHTTDEGFPELKRMER